MHHARDDHSAAVARAARTRRPTAFRPLREPLEDRRLLTASLQPIAGVTAPAGQGYVVPLDGSGTADAQTFSATSSNPDVAAAVAAGPFLTINVQYTDPKNAANDFSGPITFQLFQNLTPTAVNEIKTFTNDGYYNGKTFHRVAGNFPNPTDFIVQGGAPNPDGSGNSGQPGTPFAVEPVQPLAYTGKYQIGLAHTSQPNSNDTQFFITTGSPNFLSYNYTLFGQLVSGLGTLTKMTQVPVTFNPALNETSLPVNPVVMTTVTLSDANPNGALVVDTTQAHAGETATINVTATDATDHTSKVQTFTVNVGAYSGPADPAINFRPLADPATAVTVANRAATVTLAGRSGFPDAAAPVTLTYSILTQPTHGTVTNFNPSAGTFVYTPNPGFEGSETFTYLVKSTGPRSTPASPASHPATVTVKVSPPVDDFDGVGRSELAVYRPSTTEWFADGPGGGHLVGKFGGPGDVPVPGDYDGLGHTELAVYRPGTSQWFVLGPSGGRLLGKFGGPGDIPVPGDYDGLGHAELAVFRPSTAQWFVLGPTGGRLLGTFGGKNLSDVPVPGDYDGLGHTELAVYRPGTGQWFVLGPSGGQLLGTFGARNLVDVPVPGDYDGLGHTELAVYRPGTAQWFVLGPGGGRLAGAFGTKNLFDVPASGPTPFLKSKG